MQVACARRLCGERSLACSDLAAGSFCVSACVSAAGSEAAFDTMHAGHMHAPALRRLAITKRCRLCFH